MKTEYRPRTPPPPPRTTGCARPPPPPPSSTTSRAVPPPPPRSSFLAAPHSFTTSVVLHGATSSAMPNVLNPGFTSQVQKMSTPQLQSMRMQLQFEVIHARLTGNPTKAAQAQAKLNYVDGQLHNRKAQEMITRFQYQRELGGMSNEQLQGSHAKESRALFLAQLRGDPAGVSEARAKLSLIDGEIGRRQNELAQFQQSLQTMNPAELDGLGSQLVEQFTEALFSSTSTSAQKDNVFSKLSMLLGEQLSRDLRTSMNDWLFSK
ncbi:MAG: hypothetical protein ACOZQL_42375 [Myxococcota bacterium]